MPAATEPASWVALDRFVADAESANIKVALDLSDFATLLMKNCINPFTDLSDWDQFITYAAQRVNSVTGAAYGSDPEIAWVEFFGEPNEAGYPVSGGWHDGKYYTHRGGVAPKLGSSSDPAPDSNWGMAATGSGSCAQPLYYTSAEVTAFYAHVEATWTDLSSIPTLAGGLTKLNEQDNGGIDYQAIFANSDNDLCGFETYGAMEEWLSTGVTFCTDELNKPSVNVEWGYLQSMGDKSRAADFDAQFANNDQAGVAGNIFWNSGDQVQANSYDVGNGGIDPLTFEAVVTNAPATG